MQFIGEIISIGVAFSWTITAMASEVATKRMGVFVSNVWRMLLAFLCSAFFMYFFTGTWFPVYADGGTWLWLLFLELSDIFLVIGVYLIVIYG